MPRKTRLIVLLFVTHIFASVSGYNIGVLRENDASWGELKLEAAMAVQVAREARATCDRAGLDIGIITGLGTTGGHFCKNEGAVGASQVSSWGFGPDNSRCSQRVCRGAHWVWEEYPCAPGDGMSLDERLF